MDKIAAIESDIKSLKIQGATDVALSVLEGIRQSLDSEIPQIKNIALKLANARPTEPLAQNAVRFLFENSPDKEILKSRIFKYEQLIIRAKSEIINHSTGLIKDGGIYLTHCHSSTAVSVFKKAHENNIDYSVYTTETRPLFQGRITARELITFGVRNVTFLIDDAVFSLINKLGNEIRAIFIGADLLTGEGFVNKVGSLGMVAEANRKKIPVYVYSTLLKYDPRPFDDNLLEKRSGQEIWNGSPPELNFYAPAFDFVPYFDNVFVVSEVGIIKGKDVRVRATDRYPFIRIK